MRIDGSHVIPVEPSVLWPLLFDVNALRRIIPGCQGLIQLAEGEYRLELRQRLGPYDDHFIGTLHLTELGANNMVNFTANMESPNGMARVTGTVCLEPASNDSTHLYYEADLELGGRLEGVQSRLAETTANSFARRGLEALEREVGGGIPPYLRASLAAAPAPEPAGRRLHLHIPPWMVLGALTIVGMAILRYLDNRRIDGLARQLADRLGEEATAGNESISRTKRT